MLLFIAILCGVFGLGSANSPSIKWGQSKSQLFLNFGLSCPPTSRSSRLLGDEFWFQCGTYELQVILRGACTSVECKPGPGQSELCTLTKRDAHIWDRFTQNEKDIERFGGKLSIDYRRWEEPDEGLQEHSYANSKVVLSVDSDVEFRKILDSNPVVVADLSMKWCSLCVDKMKQVLNVARSMKSEATFVHLDTQEARGTRSQYNITCDSDCAILWVFAKNEEPQRITQGHEDVEKMVRAYISPAMTHFVDINAFTDFQNKEGHSVVGIFSGEHDYNEFGSIARSMRGSDTRFGFHFGQAGSVAFGLAGAVVPCLISKSPNGTEFLTDMRSSTMTDFVKTRALPLFPQIDFPLRSKLEKFTLFDGRKLPIAYYWTPLPLIEPEFTQKPADWNEKEDGAWEVEAHIPGSIVELAKEYRSRVYFVRGETYLMREFGLPDEVFPSFGIATSADYEPSSRYALPLQGADVTTESIKQFVEDFLARKLAPSYKTGRRSTTPWTPGEVYPVVSSMVESVLTGDYDILFYVYQKRQQDEKTASSIALVAQSLALLSSVKVVSLEASDNYLDPRLFPGQDPGLYFFARTGGGAKVPVRFVGKVGQSEVLVWMKQLSPTVAEQWDLVKSQAKKIKEDITTARAKLKEEQAAEVERLATLPRIDLSGDGGVIKQILQAGEGEPPSQGAMVKAHYTGTLLTGEIFDSSRDGGSPFDFQLGTNSVISCWDLAFASMHTGERALLTCHSKYAYGDSEVGKIPAGAILRFDVELVSWSTREAHTEL